MEKAKNELPPLDMPLRVVVSNEFFNRGSKELTSVQKDILSIVSNYGTVQEVMDKIDGEDLAVMNELILLIQKGFVATLNKPKSRPARILSLNGQSDTGFFKMRDSLRALRRPTPGKDTKVRNIKVLSKLELMLPGFTYLDTVDEGKYRIKKFRHDQTGMEFLHIPEGSFMMGSTECESEMPLHQVEIKSFLLAKTQITQAVWKKVMGTNPSKFEGDDLPVEGVSWFDCQEFCKRTGLELPTESRWEYACRAGTETKYYWGDTIDGSYAWYDSNSCGKTHPVGSRSPNPFGLFDMSGNVWEWCSDAYEKYSLCRKQKNRAKGGGSMVLRGGSWSYNENGCRSSYRYDRSSDYRSKGVGFRPAKIV
jgi:formylglycine-generating enzyme required for sulfatase activity